MTTKNQASKKILLVEDDELNLKLFLDLLLLKGFDVMALSDGHKVIKSVKKYTPDLIIMDIQLDGISGLDIAREIKTDKNLAHIPIIVITAFAMKDDKEKILGAGCQAYMSKPISIDKFYEAIAELIE